MKAAVLSCALIFAGVVDGQNPAVPVQPAVAHPSACAVKDTPAALDLQQTDLSRESDNDESRLKRLEDADARLQAGKRDLDNPANIPSDLGARQAAALTA